MPIDRIKRNRFYEAPYTFSHDSQDHHDDFVDYFLPQDRIQNAHLRQWGIAGGLTVTGAVGAAELAIEPGAAIDAAGRLIALADDGTGDIGANPPGAQHEEVPTPVALPLAGHGGQRYYVTIAYSEILRIDEGSGGRLEVVPWVRLQPVSGPGAYVDDGASVILAIVDVAANDTLGQLLASDHPTLPHGRRLADKPAGAFNVRRPVVSANTAEEEDSGSLLGREGGGLRLTVPGSGDVVAVERDNGNSFARFETRANTVTMRDSSGRDALNFAAGTARLDIGANGNGGDLRVLDSSGRRVFDFQSSTAWLRVGTDGNEGDIAVHDAEDRRVFHVNGSGANVTIGAQGSAGDIAVQDSQNREAFRVNGAAASVRVGAEGNEGDIAVYDGRNRRVFFVDGATAWLQIGTQGNEGDIAVHDGSDRRVFHFNSDTAWLELGAEGNEGDVAVLDGGGTRTIHLNGGGGEVFARELWADGRLIDANPVRQGWWGGMFVSGGTTTREVDLGTPRDFITYVVPVFVDPFINFDRDNFLAAEVYSIDGNRLPTWIHGGDHLGGDGATSNYHAPAQFGHGQRVVYRLRCPADCGAAAVAILFWA